MASPMEWPTPKPQAPNPKLQAPSALDPWPGMAESVRREARSGPRWAWWREVNPVDGEVAAQPWSNLGLVDLEADKRKRSFGDGIYRKCSPCEVTWRGEPVCINCGWPADDDGGRRLTAPGYDSHQRHLAARPQPGVST